MIKRPILKLQLKLISSPSSMRLKSISGLFVGYHAGFFPFGS